MLDICSPYKTWRLLKTAVKLSILFSFRTITSLDQLTDKMRQYLKPIYNVDGQANKVKLNLVQPAFMKAKAKDMCDTDSNANNFFIMQIIRKGLEEWIWTSEFSPSANLDFEQYLINRLKNEKRWYKNKMVRVRKNGGLYRGKDRTIYFTVLEYEGHINDNPGNMQWVLLTERTVGPFCDVYLFFFRGCKLSSDHLDRLLKVRLFEARELLKLRKITKNRKLYRKLKSAISFGQLYSVFLSHNQEKMITSL